MHFRFSSLLRLRRIKREGSKNFKGKFVIQFHGNLIVMDAEDPKGIRGLFRKKTDSFLRGWKLVQAPILGDLSLFPQDCKWNLSEIVIETDHHPVIRDHSPPFGGRNLILKLILRGTDLPRLSIKSGVRIKLFSRNFVAQWSPTFLIGETSV